MVDQVLSNFELRAKRSLKTLLKYEEELRAAALAHNVPLAKFAGILSRETDGIEKYWLPPTQGGRLGDGGNGHGPGQIDKRSFPTWCAAWVAGKHSVADALLKSAEVYRAKFDRVSKSLSTLALKEETLWRAATAAYNVGEGRVSRNILHGRSADFGTTGGDYSRDALERAQWFIAQGRFLPIVDEIT